MVLEALTSALSGVARLHAGIPAGMRLSCASSSGAQRFLLPKTSEAEEEKLASEE